MIIISTNLTHMVVTHLKWNMLDVARVTEDTKIMSQNHIVQEERKWEASHSKKKLFVRIICPGKNQNRDLATQRRQENYLQPN